MFSYFPHFHSFPDSNLSVVWAWDVLNLKCSFQVKDHLWNDFSFGCLNLVRYVFLECPTDAVTDGLPRKELQITQLIHTSYLAQMNRLAFQVPFERWIKRIPPCRLYLYITVSTLSPWPYGQNNQVLKFLICLSVIWET